MKAFNLSIGTIVLRFYLMMLIVIIAGFVGQWWLAILAFPVFMSIMLGLTFGKNTQQTAAVKKLPQRPNAARKAS
ncbi:MAG TPA: hypothetical protein PKC76_06945 [Saprospiraceae bacterium]|nr:hypothetical protein [Saprospiraceae bacterium]HMP23849.1 hypothetical protein [Saprospiraceae bacterium]